MAYLVSSAVFLDVSDVCSMVEFIGRQGESEGRVIVSHLNPFHHGIGERVEVESELVDGCFFCLSRKWLSSLGTLQMNNVWRN
mgnify:CR=1 FL=1